MDIMLKGTVQRETCAKRLKGTFVTETTDQTRQHLNVHKVKEKVFDEGTTEKTTMLEISVSDPYGSA